MNDHTDIIQRLNNAGSRARLPTDWREVMLDAASALASLPPVPQAAGAGWQLTLNAAADKVVITNATGNEELFLGAVKELLAQVRAIAAAPPAAAEVPAREEGDAGALREALAEVVRTHDDWVKQMGCVAFEDPLGDAIEKARVAIATGDRS